MLEVKIPINNLFFEDVDAHVLDPAAFTYDNQEITLLLINMALAATNSPVDVDIKSAVASSMSWFAYLKYLALGALSGGVLAGTATFFGGPHSSSQLERSAAFSPVSIELPVNLLDIEPTRPSPNNSSPPTSLNPPTLGSPVGLKVQ